MLKFTFDKKTGKTLVQRKTNKTANVFSTEYVFRTSSSGFELTEEEREEVERKVKELSQYYKATMRAWLKANRDMINMSLDFAFKNNEPHQLDIDEVLAEQ